MARFLAGQSCLCPEFRLMDNAPWMTAESRVLEAPDTAPASASGLDFRIAGGIREISGCRLERTLSQPGLSVATVSSQPGLAKSSISDQPPDGRPLDLMNHTGSKHYSKTLKRYGGQRAAGGDCGLPDLEAIRGRVGVAHVTPNCLRESYPQSAPSPRRTPNMTGHGPRNHMRSHRRIAMGQCVSLLHVAARNIPFSLRLHRS